MHNKYSNTILFFVQCVFCKDKQEKILFCKIKANIFAQTIKYVI